MPKKDENKKKKNKNIGKQKTNCRHPSIKTTTTNTQQQQQQTNNNNNQAKQTIISTKILKYT